MDAIHLHLLLNHFPILGSLFGLCLLAYGWIRKNNALEGAGLVTLVIVGLLTVPVFLTGEEAEETVEGLAGVSERFLEQHEELAEVALWLMIATAALALSVLVFSRLIPAKGSRLLKVAVVFLAAGTFGTMTAVGNDGGKIRHSEIRGEVPAKQPAEATKHPEQEDED